MVPKLIHPLPPPLQSPDSSPEHVMEGTWMQVRFSENTFTSSFRQSCQGTHLVPITSLLFMAFYRSLTYNGHPRQQEEGHNLLMTAVLLLTYDRVTYRCIWLIAATTRLAQSAPAIHSYDTENYILCSGLHDLLPIRPT